MSGKARARRRRLDAWDYRRALTTAEHNRLCGLVMSGPEWDAADARHIAAWNAANKKDPQPEG